MTMLNNGLICKMKIQVHSIRRSMNTILNIIIVKTLFDLFYIIGLKMTESSLQTDGVTYVTTLNSVSAADNGIYTCTATTEVTPNTPITKTKTVEITVYGKCH